MNLSVLSFQLLYHLGLGTFLSLGFVHSRELGKNYFVYRGILCFLLALLANWFLDRFHQNSYWVFVYATLIYSLGFPFFEKYQKIIFAAVALTGFLPLFDLVVKQHQFWFGLNLLMVSLVLGFALATMLLGHWYLVQPKLSIQVLAVHTAILITLVSIRALWGTGTLVSQVVGLSEMEFYRYFGSFPGLFVLMRWIWGLAAPLGLLWMVWQTVKIRSTQSATGILYVVCLCVMIGETLSLYLSTQFGING